MLYIGNKVAADVHIYGTVHVGQFSDIKKDHHEVE